MVPCRKSVDINVSVSTYLPFLLSILFFLLLLNVGVYWLGRLNTRKISSSNSEPEVSCTEFGKMLATTTFLYLPPSRAGDENEWSFVFIPPTHTYGVVYKNRNFHVYGSSDVRRSGGTRLGCPGFKHLVLGCD
jgi:hypothetical protein